MEPSIRVPLLNSSNTLIRSVGWAVVALSFLFLFEKVPDTVKSVNHTVKSDTEAERPAEPVAVGGQQEQERQEQEQEQERQEQEQEQERQEQEVQEQEQEQERQEQERQRMEEERNAL